MMRRLSGILLAGAILVLPALTQNAFAQAAAPQKFTMDGELSLWSVAINADKTADYEKILGRVKEVLGKSSDAEAKQQLAGWKVMKMAKPMPDGKIIYTHIITPVPGADYNILQLLYKTITDPTEQKTIYDMYRGAFGGNLSLAGGAIIADMSK
jgi:hypothetical protein